jgi:hypothetical protein
MQEFFCLKFLWENSFWKFDGSSHSFQKYNEPFENIVSGFVILKAEGKDGFETEEFWKSAKSVNDESSDSDKFFDPENDHDMVSVKYKADRKYVYLALKFRKNFEDIVITEGEDGKRIIRSTDGVDIFIDRDNNAVTGFPKNAQKSGNTDEKVQMQQWSDEYDNIQGYEISYQGSNGMTPFYPFIMPNFRAFSDIKNKTSKELVLTETVKTETGNDLELNIPLVYDEESCHVIADKNTIYFRIPRIHIGTKSDKIKVIIADHDFDKGITDFVMELPESEGGADTVTVRELQPEEPKSEPARQRDRKEKRRKAEAKKKSEELSTKKEEVPTDKLLRSQPRTLSDEDIQAIVKRHKFFSKNKWRIWHNESGDFKNDFIDNGDGTVTDNATNLMWQRSGSDKYMRHDEADAYIKKLNTKQFAGYNDWRLPTIEEIASLLENKNTDNLYIDPVFDRKQRWCWSADKHNQLSGVAWLVYLDSGSVGWGDDLFYARAVRDR